MRLSLRDKTQLYTELAKMVKAGFGFDKSAAVLEEQAANSAQRSFAQSIQGGLKNGKTISQSIDKSELGVSDLETSVIRASEEGGVLEDGFGYLRDYFSTVRQTRSQIRSRLIYPAVILHFGILIPPVLKSITNSMTGAAKVNVGAEILTSLLVIYAIVAVFWIGGSWLHRAARKGKPFDRFLRFLPLIGPTRRAIALERFTNVFRIYILCGQKISNGLEAAGDATQSAVVDSAAKRIAEIARQGNSIGDAFLAESDFPRDFARSTANAEQTGTLEEDLKRWSSFFSDSVVQQMEKIGFWTPRILSVLVMVYVGWQIVSWYAGYLNNALDMMDMGGF